MINISHYTVVQTHVMRKSRSEESWKLYTVGGNDISLLVQQL